MTKKCHSLNGEALDDAVSSLTLFLLNFKGAFLMCLRACVCLYLLCFHACVHVLTCTCLSIQTMWNYVIHFGLTLMPLLAARATRGAGDIELLLV